MRLDHVNLQSHDAVEIGNNVRRRTLFGIACEAAYIRIEQRDLDLLGIAGPLAGVSHGCHGALRDETLEPLAQCDNERGARRDVGLRFPDEPGEARQTDKEGYRRDDQDWAS